MRRHAVHCALWLSIVLAIAGPAAAPVSAQAAAAVPSPVLTPEQQNEAREIEGLLMCPVCEGQTVQESNSEVAQEMKLKIRQMLAEGRTRQEILDHFAREYGDWILSEPPARGAGLLAWMAPALLLVLGAGVPCQFHCWTASRTLALDAASRGHLVSIAPNVAKFKPPSGGPSQPGGGPPPGSPAVDPELRRKIDDRLKDYL